MKPTDSLNLMLESMKHVVIELQAFRRIRSIWKENQDLGLLRWHLVEEILIDSEEELDKTMSNIIKKSEASQTQNSALSE